MSTREMWYRVVTWWIAGMFIAVIFNGWAGFALCFIFGFFSGMVRWHPLPFMYKRYQRVV